MRRKIYKHLTENNILGIKDRIKKFIKPVKRKK